MPPASLHETHSPITGRFPVAGPGTDLRLSPAELREFEENGFLAGLDLLGPAEVEELRELYDARGILHGTFDEVGSRLEELEGAGVSRYYLQRFNHLAEEDTGDLERILAPLVG